MTNQTGQIIGAIPRLRRFAYSLTGNTSDADDLVQACLEKALKNRTKYTDTGDIAPWLFKIMKNTFIDHTRAQARRPAFVELETSASQATADRQPTPEEALAHRDTLNAIDGLPEEQKLIVALVLVDGRSYQEAADILRIPVGTVMSRLARARRRLQEELQDQRRSA
ncbi:MAG: RNA polymerase sigma factor [Pseudomonadota bacterium]